MSSIASMARQLSHASRISSGVGGTPVRSAIAGPALVGEDPTPTRLREAARAAAAALRPDGDLHASAQYRRRVAEVLAERTLTAALGRCATAA